MEATLIATTIMNIVFLITNIFCAIFLYREKVEKTPVIRESAKPQKAHSRGKRAPVVHTDEVLFMKENDSLEKNRPMV